MNVRKTFSKSCSFIDFHGAKYDRDLASLRSLLRRQISLFKAVGFELVDGLQHGLDIDMNVQSWLVH